MGAFGGVGGGYGMCFVLFISFLKSIKHFCYVFRILVRSGGRAVIHELKEISDFAMSHLLLSIIFFCDCFR